MPNWLLALLMKPFVAAALLLTLYGIKVLVLRIVPDGRLRRILLLPIGRKRRNG